ncbi:toprim domain-containing protein [Alistipes sp.]|uniref:toprim domain-containing protein n=1 Tax=Alistipes sp. TaxID=1872444 RepID=UPI003AEFDD62
MTIEEMRRLPLSVFLQRLGCNPVWQKRNDLWYNAPYREEKTPSFKVNTDRNIWFDFGLGRGGDIFTLAGELIRSTDFLAQTRYISDTAAGVSVPVGLPPPVREKVSEPAFQQVEEKALAYDVLKGYLSERGIPPDVAVRHCREVSYRVHGKPYFAIGFPNVAGGWELRSRQFKGCIPPKDISLVSRQQSPTGACDVFEGFFDFLSAATLGLSKGNDAVVLNSVGNLARAFRHLDGYGKINCYLDNDEAGRRTFEALRARYKERAVDCSGVYAGSKDLNEHLQMKLSEKVTNNKSVKNRL